MNEFPFKGQPRRWYMAPFILGLILILAALLILKWPIILQLLVAIPLLLAGIGFTLIGLDLWRGAGNWRTRVRNAFWRMGPPTE